MKKVVLLVLSLALVLSFCGCTIIYGKLAVEIKDRNGEEDFSLAVLTDEELCADITDAYVLIYTGHTEGDETSFADQDMVGDSDRNKAFAEARTPFSGVTHIHPTYGKSDSITFTVTSERTSGNMRVYLFNYTTLEIVHDFPVGETESFTVDNAYGNEYEIRIAGESAVFKIESEREFN